MMKHLLVLVLLFLLNVHAEIQELCLFDPAHGRVGNSDEGKLVAYLLKGYERSIRPVRRSASMVNISLGITLTQIIDVNEKDQIMTVQLWLEQHWKDENLKWNPKLFNGIRKVQFPSYFIWRPDLVLYNSVDDYTTEYMESHIIVHNDGSVFWPPIVRFRVSCTINISFFPFDEQVCHMKIGSWLYNGKQVDVNPFQNRTTGPVDTSRFIKNGEWDLFDVFTVKNTMRYESVPVPFHDITFYIHLRRKTVFFVFNIIIPCMLLSLLTIFAFLLPAESGEKVTLGLKLLLAYSMFTLKIAENMPATSTAIPLLGMYLMLVMGMTAASTIMTLLVLSIYFNAFKIKRRPPKWMRFLLIDLILFELCGKTNVRKSNFEKARRRVQRFKGIERAKKKQMRDRGRKGQTKCQEKTQLLKPNYNDDDGHSSPNVTGSVKYRQRQSQRQGTRVSFNFDSDHENEHYEGCSLKKNHNQDTVPRVSFTGAEADEDNLKKIYRRSILKRSVKKDKIQETIPLLGNDLQAGQEYCFENEQLKREMTSFSIDESSNPFELLNENLKKAFSLYSNLSKETVAESSILEKLSPCGRSDIIEAKQCSMENLDTEGEEISTDNQSVYSFTEERHMRYMEFWANAKKEVVVIMNSLQTVIDGTDSPDKDFVAEEWCKIGKGLDVIMFYIYLLTHIIGGVLLLVWAPTLKKAHVHVEPIVMEELIDKINNRTIV